MKLEVLFQLISIRGSPNGVILLPGIPNLITADMIKEGAAVIDVGINRVLDPETGKSRLVGDVDFEGKREQNIAH